MIRDFHHVFQLASGLERPSERIEIDVLSLASYEVRFHESSYQIQISRFIYRLLRVDLIVEGAGSKASSSSEISSSLSSFVTFPFLFD